MTILVKSLPLIKNSHCVALYIYNVYYIYIVYYKSCQGKNLYRKSLVVFLIINYLACSLKIVYINSYNNW